MAKAGHWDGRQMMPKANHDVIHATPADVTVPGAGTAIDPNGTLPTMVWSPIITPVLT
jgi:hypothetical protein